jgi:hypothetical protein
MEGGGNNNTKVFGASPQPGTKNFVLLFPPPSIAIS